MRTTASQNTSRKYFFYKNLWQKKFLYIFQKIYMLIQLILYINIYYILILIKEKRINSFYLLPGYCDH